MTRAKQIRTWLADNGYECPAFGAVPARLVALYDEQHQDSPAGDEPETDEQPWSVTITLPPGVDPDVVDTISAHLLEALWHAYYAGHAAGRAPLDELLEKVDALA